MSVNKAVILNRVEDAKHCIANNLCHDSILFSTNTSVDTYLKYEHNIECKCLSHFLEEQYIIKELKDCRIDSDKIVKELDAQFSAEINKFYGFEKMSFFKCLYSYILMYHLVNCKTILRALDIVIEQHNLDHLSIYELHDEPFLKLPLKMKDMTSLLEKKINVEIIYNEAKTEKKSNYRKIFRSPRKALTKIKEYIKDLKLLYFKDGRDTVLLYEGLYDLLFLKKELKNFNIIYCKEPDCFPVFLRAQKDDVKKLELNIGSKKDSLTGLMKTLIKKHFEDNIQNYISAVKYLDILHKRYDIKAAVCGNSPALDIKSIIFEYLKSKNVPVIIGAHGFNYGLQDQFRYHFNSDYKRCDYFLSYGFTKIDLLNLYGEDAKSIKCEILPYGSKMIRNPEKLNIKKRKIIDILFPITTNISLFGNTLVRIKPELLTEIQIRLLKYLDSKKNYSIAVKPLFSYNDYSGCSVIPILRRLRNVRVIDHLSFSDALEKYDVKSVLIENITTTLGQAVPYDTEIFALGCSMDFFEQSSLELLKKRIYYSLYVEDIMKFMDLFLEKNLAKKRDEEFLNRYLVKENRETNIINMINHLAKNYPLELNEIQRKEELLYK